MATGISASIDTIVALRAYSGASPTLGQVYTFDVQGYNSGDDGGGGTFSYMSGDTSTPDDGGTIIVDLMGRRWRRVYAGDICWSWFGPDSTGGVDSAAAIQRAADAAKAANVGLVGSAGIFKTTATLNFTSANDNFCFRGAGQTRTTVLCSANDVPIVLIGGRFNHFTGCTLAYQTPQDTSMSGGACLASTGTHSFSRISDLYLKGGYRCLDYGAAGAAGQYNNVFSNIRMEDPYWSFFRFGGTDGSSGSTYVDLYCSAIGRDAIEYCGEISNAVTGEFYRLNTERSTVRAGGIVTTGSDNVTIEGWNAEQLSIIGSGSTASGSEGAVSCVPCFLNTSGRGNPKVRNFVSTSCQVGPQVVTNLVFDGTTATATVSDLSFQQKLATSTHGCRAGDTIIIAGAADVAYNGVKTVTAVSAATVSFAVTGSPMSPAIVAAGNDYITLQLGNAAYGAFRMLSTAGTPGNIEWDGIYFRKTFVTGSSGLVRQNMLRPYGGTTNSIATVKFDNISLFGTSALPAYWHAPKKLAGYSLAGNVATFYFSVPHRLFGTPQIKVVGAANATFNGIWTVVSILDDFTVTVAVTGANIPLTRDTVATAILVLTTTTNIVVNAGVATITTAANHGLSPYQRIGLNSTDNPSINTSDAAVLSTPTLNTFTCATSSGNINVVDITGVVQLYESGFAQLIYTLPNNQPSLNSIKRLDWLFQGGAILSTGSIPAGMSIVETMTLYGAYPNDSYQVGFSSQPTVGLVVTAYSFARDTVAFAIQNPTAGALTFTPQFVKFSIRR